MTVWAQRNEGKIVGSLMFTLAVVFFLLASLIR